MTKQPRQTRPSPASALAGLRVLDLTGHLGAYAGRMLAGLGADVINVSPAAGHPRWLDFGKRPLPLDLDTSSGRDAFLTLLDQADILLETTQPGYLAERELDWRHLKERRPGLVMVSLTPFGHTGPQRDWRGGDLIALATGGLLHLAGAPGSPPAQPGGNQACLLGGVVACSAALVALRERKRAGHGQWVDLSLQDIVVGALENAIGFADMMGLDRGRSGGRVYSGEQVFYRAKDGWLASRIGNRADAFSAWLASAGIAIEGWDPELWHDLEYRTAHLEQFGAALEALALKSSKDEFVSIAQHHRIPAAQVATVLDLYADPQLAAREFWLDVELADGSLVRYPGAPFRMTATPYRVAVGPSPSPASGWLPRDEAQARGISTSPSAGDTGHHLPLQGLRVLDFTWVIAGPAATQILADHGADVIKVEGPNRPDGLRRVGPPRPPWTDSENGSGMFHLINGSKKSVAINLSIPEGVEMLRKLIPLVDVIVDNYGVDPFPKWGLDEAAVRQLNPDVIIARSSVMGRSGPRTRFVGLGYTIGAAAGLNALSGFPVDPPSGTGTAHPDYSSNPYHLLIATLAALEHRDRTGQGQTIDLSQHESTVVFAGDGFDHYVSTGELIGQNANRDPRQAPHGVFRSRGEDRWVAIACQDDRMWQSLARTIGRDDLAEDATLATLAGRKAAEDALDRAISAWTFLRTPDEAAAILQSAGVAAGPVRRGHDLFRDPQLRSRAKLVRIEHPYLGKTRIHAAGFKFSETPGYLQRHSPLLGQDTETTLTGLLGLEEEAMAEAYIAGVL